MSDPIKDKISGLLLEWGNPKPVDVNGAQYKTWLDRHKHSCQQILRQLQERKFPLSFIGPLLDRYSEFIIDLKKAGKLNGTARKRCNEAVVLLCEYYIQNRDAAFDLVASSLTFDQIALRANNLINSEH